jgi:hypothetical protein
MTVVRFVEFAAEDDPFMEANPPGLIVDGPFRASTNKNADVADHRTVSGQVGLLVDEPPGPAGLPFIQSSDDI